MEEWCREADADELVAADVAANGMGGNVSAAYESRVWPITILQNFHDAAYLYGLALAHCLRAQNACNHTSGADMMEQIKGQRFNGTSGWVVMKQNFEREVAFIYSGVEPTTGERLEFKLAFYEDAISDDGSISLSTVRRFPWATADGAAPLDEPRCGFRGDGCPKSLTNRFLYAAATFGLVAVLALLAVTKYRAHQFEVALLAKSWEVKQLDIRMVKAAASTSLRDLGSVARASLFQNSMTGEGGEERWGFVGPAVLKGKMVAVKQYEAREEIRVQKRMTLVALKALKELHHDHLSAFVGLCLDKKDRLVAVWELCKKGSLSDVLYNEEIQLDGSFRGSIVRDIVLGLDYLHASPVGVHGALTSENCLVDARWTVKLTDFGLSQALAAHRLRGAFRPKPYSADKLIHLAPELLGSWDEAVGLKYPATQEADVYALGVILFQILTREYLYDSELKTDKEMAADLVSGRIRGYRPKVPDKLSEDPGPEVSGTLLPLMRKCWLEVPAERPKLAAVRKIVMSLSSANVNLVEHMMSVMEKYAANLEGLVQSRTLQVQEERLRAEELLARMLPASVAEELKAGRVVAPETFESVTIYFSDIVGFTRISGRLEPLQVVEFLNYLYLTFDEVITRFDAYKVETIGDAYMVASGLPTRNGFQHVLEMAELALSIREAVAEMAVPHQPEEPLLIRIGLHSGPVAAGVVGNAMPRYCLFGDTVNVASRMESTSEAMKVQVSESTKGLLDQYANGRFDVTLRGTTSVKGKGDMSTYWLNRHDQVNDL